MLNKNEIINNIKNVFSTITDSNEITNQKILELLNNVNPKINNESIANLLLTESTPPYNEQLKKQFDLLLTSTDNWWFIDENGHISKELDVDFIEINQNHVLNTSNVPSYFDEFNTLGKLETILNSNTDLKNLLDQEFPNALLNVEWDNKFYNENNNLAFDIKLTFNDNSTQTVRVISKVKILSFDKTEFSEWLKNDVTSELQIQGNELCNNLSQFLKFPNETFNGDIFVIELTNSTNTHKLELNGSYYSYLFNFAFSIKDSGYCFLTGTSAHLNNPEDLNNMLTKIYESIEIGQSNIDNLVNSLTNVTIDNYKEYFNNANNLPESENSGKMLNTKLSELMKLPEDSVKDGSVVFTKSGNTDDGYLKVNISFELNDPFKYNGQSIVNLENILTGMYDPNSEYNVNLFTYADSNTKESLIGVTTEGDKLEIVYLPYSVKYLSTVDNYFANHLRSATKFIGSYSSLIDFSYNSTFSNSSISEFYFENLENFVGFPGKQNTFQYAKATYISFENCPKFNFSTQNRNNGAFEECNSLVTLNFKGCNSLTYLGQDFIKRCYALQHLYLNNSPINTIDNSAFYDFQYINGPINIYVLNASVQDVVYSSIKRQNNYNTVTINWHLTE